MSYQSTVEMAGSPSLASRITAAAAGEGLLDPLSWTQSHIWHVVSAPGWAPAWDSAKQSQTDDDNPDTGMRPGVITDGMILSAVQAVIAEG